LVNDSAENCVPSATEFLDSWDCTAGPSFKAEKMIAGAIHMTLFIDIFYNLLLISYFFYLNRVPQGLSKSKRKEFRDKELERLRERG
jgi:hypothetical protein